MTFTSYSDWKKNQLSFDIIEVVAALEGNLSKFLPNN